MNVELKTLMHKRERMQEKFCFLLPFVMKIVRRYMMTDKKDRKMREKNLKNTTEMTSESHPEVYKELEAIAAKLDVQMPEVYVADTENKNCAFISGTGEGFVVMSRYYVEGAEDFVLKSMFAHECGHKKFNHLVKRRAYRLISVFETIMIVGVLVMAFDIQDSMWASIIVPIVSSLVCFEWALYKFRSQELTADRCSAYVVGKEERIEAMKVNYGWDEERMASLKGWRGRLKRLRYKVRSAVIKTHPSWNDRISQVEKTDFKGIM